VEKRCGPKGSEEIIIRNLRFTNDSSYNLKGPFFYAHFVKDLKSSVYLFDWT